jgi:hypothetical protein
VLNKDRRDEQTIELAPLASTTATPPAGASGAAGPASASAANVYAASFFVHSSGTYQIRLLSPESLAGGVELWNRDDHPRSVEARFDQPPTVAIISPKKEETVGPDEQVPRALAGGRRLRRRLCRGAGARRRRRRR